MNSQFFMSDDQLIDSAQLSEAEFDELENQLALKADCLGWTGDPTRQPVEVVAAIVRAILSRR